MDYYYMAVEYFKKAEIRWLMKQENGSLYVMMYMQLCMKAWKCNTYVLRPVHFQASRLHPDDMLMQLTECDRTAAQTCLMYLLKLNLIVLEPGNGIAIPEVKDQLGEALKNERDEADGKENTPVHGENRMPSSMA